MTNTSEAADDESDDTSREPAKNREPAKKGSGTRKRAAAPKSPPRKRLRPTEALREAREQLMELTGKSVDSVSSFRATDDDGWLLEVEVLELSRVPDTMSLLASYEVALDGEGMLTGYRRLRRYERGRSDDRH